MKEQSKHCLLFPCCSSVSAHVSGQPGCVGSLLIAENKLRLRSQALLRVVREQLSRAGGELQKQILNQQRIGHHSSGLGRRM